MPFWFRFLVRYLICSAALLALSTFFFVLLNIIDGKSAFDEWGLNYLAGHLLMSFILGFVLAELTSRPSRRQNHRQETTPEITSES